MPGGRQSGYSVVPLSPPHSDDKIRKAANYLQKTSTTELYRLKRRFLGPGGPKAALKRDPSPRTPCPGVGVLRGNGMQISTDLHEGSPGKKTGDLLADAARLAGKRPDVSPGRESEFAPAVESCTLVGPR
jgi:hypothetical protein